MAKPTVKVEIAFTDGPYVTSPTWTDVTSYVRSVSTRRGRSSDWDDFGSGTASVVLDNRDRRYDPTYTSGPYYGNLKPRRQIRVTADAGTGGGYVAVFRGFIAGWPVEVTEAGYDSTVTLQCFDLLGLLSQEETPREWADYYIRNTLAPRHYWRLDRNINPSDIPQTTAALPSFTLTDYGSAPENLIPSSAAVPIANAEPLANGLTSRSISFAPNTQTFGAASTTNNFANGNSYSWSIWGLINDGSGTGLATVTTLAIYSTTAGNQYLAFENYYNITNRRFEIFVRQAAASSQTRTYYFPIGLDITVPHHYALTVTITGSNTITPTLYIDGQTITNTTNVTGTSLPFTGATNNYFNIWASTSQQCLYTEGTTWSASQIQTLYGLGNNVLTETTAARFSRLLDTTPVPAAWENPTASPAGTVAPFTVGGTPIITELETVATSEGGELYVTKAGVLDMTNRTYFATNTKSITNQATFGSAGNIPIAPQASYVLSADDIRNSLEITWAGDTTVSVVDSGSVTEYGAQQATYSTQLSTLTDAQNLGNYQVGYGKTPRLVFSDTVVGQALTGAQWATVLGLELLERITVVIDVQTGNDPTQVQLVQAIAHEITPGDWRTTITGSARWAYVFILDTSTLDGPDLLA